MALATENKIRHTIKIFRFDEINKYLDLISERATLLAEPDEVLIAQRSMPERSETGNDRER